jgi:multiple sugar transport system ATP-binding protein
MTEIQLRNIDKYFGPVHVIREINLTVMDREFVVLLGPSGCGKTTTLRAIAGLEDIDSGDILIDGKPVQDLHASDRDVAFVFQNYALYPHLTVYENMAFPLRAVHQKREDIDKTVRSVAASLGITGLLKRRPSALSGGDMQRVAIGRSLVRRPKAILLDEPIGSLDAKLRESMRVELKRLHIENGSTSIYVTHDQVEAMSLADRIVVMHEGLLQQVGTPDEVYRYPANIFVAQFVGSPVMNLEDAAISEGAAGVGVSVGVATFSFPAALAGKLKDVGAQTGKLKLGVRPEGVLLSHQPQDGYIEVTSGIIEPLGSHDIVDLAVGDAVLRARTKSGFVAGPGLKVWARIDPAQAHFFNTTTGSSLGIRL